jgi:hypothetical protein
MKKLILMILPVVDFLVSLFVYPSAWRLKQVRVAGVHRLPHCKNVLMKIGVSPIRDHYYEPQSDNRSSNKPLLQDRILPEIDWNITGQKKSFLSFHTLKHFPPFPLKNPAHL